MFFRVRCHGQLRIDIHTHALCRCVTGMLFANNVRVGVSGDASRECGVISVILLPFDRACAVMPPSVSVVQSVREKSQLARVTQ